MFLFIGNNIYDIYLLSNLNTSYVLIYLIPLVEDYEKRLEFKYILCSYLSMHLTVVKELVKNLNTSYVLIYRFRRVHWRELSAI